MRFDTESTPKPLVIVTPNNVTHIQATVSCCVKHGMQIRVRSGGHDYEGLSQYSTSDPFMILDLVNIRRVSVDLADNTAWIQSGAQLGDVYYRIEEESTSLGFPAVVCVIVGFGGHFSGGGHGMLLRKYGLAADQIIDAQLIDVKGRIFDRAGMGEDLFWAIRGGGGNTFGVVVAWRVQLVPVPPFITVFNVTRTLEQNATKIVHRWQYAIRKFDEDLFSRIFISKISTSSNNSSDSKPTILTGFTSLFLGGIDRLLRIMQESFPALGLVREDCIESALYFDYFPSNTSFEALLNRKIRKIYYGKGKSDYVKEPIPEKGLEGIWEMLLELDSSTHQKAQMQFTAYGGRMDEISESSIPFLHRAGTLFQIHYSVTWVEDGIEEAEWHINWMRRIYDFMGPYVSNNPRSAYVNYRDLDIGINNPDGDGNSTSSYEKASIWGRKYFHDNFDRLVRIKTAIDPSNFFGNQKSIPPLSLHHINSSPLYVGTSSAID